MDGAILGRSRDVTLGSLQIPAARYDARRKRLEVIDSVDVTVTFEGGTHTFSGQLESPWEQAQRRLRDSLLNANVVRGIPPAILERCGEEMLVITNPATLGAGSAPLRAYLSAGGRLIAMSGGAPKVWATDKTVDTPFVSVPGLLTAECKTNDFATYLEIKVNGDPADPRVDDISGDLGAVGKPLANWGLHLVDVNLAMGNLLDLVDAQSKAYRSRR